MVRRLGLMKPYADRFDELLGPEALVVREGLALET